MDQKDLFLLLKETDTIYSDSKKYLKKERKKPPGLLIAALLKFAHPHHGL